MRTNLNPHPARGAALLWLVLALVVLIGGSIWLWRERSTAPKKDDTVLYTVSREKLRISTIESGQLKAAKSVDIYSEVRGNSTILELVDEGKQVHKGDLLVRLDAATLEDDLTAQKIKYEQALAAYIQAQKTKEIQQSLNLSNIETAKLNRDLAATDLTKYVEGDWKIKLQQASSDIKLADATQLQADQKYKDTKELVDLDFAAEIEAQTDQLSLQQAQIKLEMSTLSKDIMERFEYKRQIQVLQTAKDQTEAELVRVQLRCDADIAQKEADERSKKATLDLETSKKKQLEDQVVKCVIKAPSDGLVVYPMNQSGMGGRGSSDRAQIEEGATVHEHQLLISLPDTSDMVVVVSVHESAIDKLKLGQPAEIRIDALPEKTFIGKVTFIAPLPDSQNQWLNPDLKVYRCEATIGGDTSTLRPGMGASAEIVIDEVPDAISVPVHAVHRRGEHYFCYVESSDGRPLLREVKIGPHNDHFVAIAQGLDQGEHVFLAIPPGAPQPDFPESTKQKQTSVEELRKQAEGIAAKTDAPKADGGRRDDKREGRDGREGHGPNGPISAEQREAMLKNMTPEQRAQMDKWNKMSPEERQKAMEDMKKKFGGGGGGGGAPADGNGSGGKQ